MGGETWRKFIYRNQGTGLCFHQAFNPVAGPPGHVLPGPPSGSGNAFISKYLADLGYNQDMIVWATIADPQHRLCLNPGLAEKKFHIDFWYNTEDGQHYTLPGNHGLLPPAPPAPLLSQGDGATPPQPEPSQRVEPEFASSGATGVTPIPRRAHTASSTANLRCLVLVRAHPKMGYRRLGFDQ